MDGEVDPQSQQDQHDHAGEQVESAVYDRQDPHCPYDADHQWCERHQRQYPSAEVTGEQKIDQDERDYHHDRGAGCEGVHLVLLKRIVPCETDLDLREHRPYFAEQCLQLPGCLEQRVDLEDRVQGSAGDEHHPAIQAQRPGIPHEHGVYCLFNRGVFLSGQTGPHDLQGTFDSVHRLRNFHLVIAHVLLVVGILPLEIVVDAAKETGQRGIGEAFQRPFEVIFLYQHQTVVEEVVDRYRSLDVVEQVDSLEPRDEHLRCLDHPVAFTFEHDYGVRLPEVVDHVDVGLNGGGVGREHVHHVSLHLQLTR